VRRLALAATGLVALAATASGQTQPADSSLLDRRANLDITAVQLDVALQNLALRAGIPIAFSPDIVSGPTLVSCQCLDVAVDEALDTLLQGTGLVYAEMAGTVAVGPPVPALGFGVSLSRVATTRRARDVSGRVVSGDDGTPVVGAVVRGIESGGQTLSDRLGQFVLHDVPPRSERLVIQAAGFATDTTIAAPNQNDITVTMYRTAIELAPVTITADALRARGRTRFDSTTQSSAITIEPVDITNVPGMFEADVIRAVQLLPGAIAKSDYSISYNVRGGEGDQNLVRLDGVTVFNPSHLGGLFSTFDANAVDRVDFFTGGFPASYPGRLSSVLDISLRDGRRDGLHGAGQVSLLSSKILLEGPLGPISYVVGARRTYADAVVSTFTRYSLPYYFADAVAKLHMPLGSAGSLSLTGYWGRDDLFLDLASYDDEGDPTGDEQSPIDIVFNWGNRLAGLTWRWPLHGAVVETRASVTKFFTTLAFKPELARWGNDVRLLSASTDVTVAPWHKHQLHVGTGVERYDMTYDLVSPMFEFGDQPGNYGGLIPLFNHDYHPTIWSLYADDEWDAASWLKLRPGIRLEHVPVAAFTGIAPRASFKLFLTSDKALIGSVGRYHQAVHSLRDQELPVTIYEFWIGADEFVPVAQTDHLVLGYEQWFGRGFQLNVEAYRKAYRNLVIPNSAQSMRDVGNQYRTMEGDSWGVDVLLRRHTGRVQGWISYGFNKTERRADGMTFPPAHDRRHMLNVVLRAPGPLGSELGVRWGWGSPLPYTGLNGEWSHRDYRLSQHSFDGGETEPISTAINAERFPSYSRLDVGLRWQFDKWGIQWSPYVQVANLYNRRNVFIYVFDYGSRPATRSGVSQVPLFPTFGIEFKW
jgi:hypothetical protein